MITEDEMREGLGNLTKIRDTTCLEVIYQIIKLFDENKLIPAERLFVMALLEDFNYRQIRHIRGER